VIRSGPCASPHARTAPFPCRYPGLFLTCYYFALKWCAHEPVFQVSLHLSVRPPCYSGACPRAGGFFSLPCNRHLLSIVQPYFPAVAAALLEHLAPGSVRQPSLPSDAPSAPSSGAQVQSLDTAGQTTQAQLKAADSALLAAQQAAAAASAAAAALVAAQAGAAQQLPLAQQPLASPPHQQPELMLARSPEASVHPGDSDASIQEAAAAAATPARPHSSGSRPARSERPPPGLQYEPSLPEHDMPPVDVVDTDGGRVALFPQRPEAPVCEFYMKTGHCR
jgi:hypothetical protein